jgi:crotonobetainyl-CoA hydratase
VTEAPPARLVLLELRDHVAIVTLNRPEVLNAINIPLSRSLGEILEQCSANPDVRSIVLAGNGRAFCAGQDLAVLADGGDVLEREHPEWGYAGVVRHRIDKPIVVAAQGYMLGAGLEIALSCDIIVASRSLQLGLPEVRRGIIAAAAGVPRIAQHLPPHVAAWLVFSGEFMGADEAMRWGLVNEVVDEDRVLSRALELAARMAESAPLAVQASKRILRDLTSESTWDERPWEILAEELAKIRSTADADEGARAFLEKRPPRWSGT